MITALELRQLLNLYTQPTLTRPKAQLAADTLRRMGLIEIAQPPSELPMELTDKGRQYVKDLLAQLDDSPVKCTLLQERQNGWSLLLRNGARQWSIEDSELQKRKHVLPNGTVERLMLGPLGWVTDIRMRLECTVTSDEGGVQKWTCPSQDEEDSCTLVIFND